MRKLLLLAIIAINFSVLPSFGADSVIIDRITQSEAEELDLTIPDEVPAGFHSIEIEVYDDAGTVSKKEIPFCKNLDGEIHWDNICPDVLEAQNAAALDLVKTPEGLKPYSPLSDPEKTKDLQVAALAALAALGAAKKSDDKKDEDSQEEIESVEAGELELLKNEPGWGDLSGTWDNRFTEAVDFAFIRASNWANRFSPLLTRTIQDGNLLRAIFGSWSLILVPVALGLGLSATVDVGGHAIPPAWTIVAVIMAIAIFDALAGLLAGTVFFLGALLTGNLMARSSILTVAATIVLLFAPALIGSSFRPLRRLINNRDERWERLTDYSLMAVLTYWLVTKMVGGLSGIANLELPITSHAHDLGLLAASLLIVRIAFEDVATHLYPVRLEILHVDIEEPSTFQKIISLEFKIFVFIMLARPFVGYNLQLWLGAALFAIPSITALGWDEKLPKKKLILPRGALKIIVLIFVLGLFANFAQGLFENPETFLKWSFVILALPGFALHYLDAITDTPESRWRVSDSGRLIYRFGGIVVFILIVMMVRGVDLAGWLI